MDHKAIKAHFLDVHTANADGIFRFCLVKTSSPEIAQDLAQEVFMRFWQTLRERKDIENERAFLYTIARNLITDWYRKKKSSSLDVLQEEGIEFGSDDHRQMMNEAQMREALDVVKLLDDASREVLMMRFVEGLPPQEIAQVLGEPVNRISVRINRAIKKVQEILNHE